ncbi:hypothetical protein ACSSS7_000488 [Eimeria intestinalis]
MNCLGFPAAAAAAAPREPLEIVGRHGRGGFNPYVNNGGTVVCVAGDDFVIGVGDTRLSLGYSIQSRMQSKITQLYVMSSQQSTKAAFQKEAPFLIGLCSFHGRCCIPMLQQLLLQPLVRSCSAHAAAAAASYAAAAASATYAANVAVAAPYGASAAVAVAAVTIRTSRCGIASSGMQADIQTLHKFLKTRVALFKHQHREEPSVVAVAQLLSTVLYSRRFFPYYTFNVLFGLDSEGKGAVYGYDAIGSFERAQYNCAGTGCQLTMSILDNQVGRLLRCLYLPFSPLPLLLLLLIECPCLLLLLQSIARNNQTRTRPPMTKEETVAFVRGVLASAGERDIFTGDHAELVLIDSAGVHSEFVPLRND